MANRDTASSRRLEPRRGNGEASTAAFGPGLHATTGPSRVCDVDFGWRGVGDLHVVKIPEGAGGEVGGAGGVAGPAANDEATIGAAAGCDFADVVGGEVGGRVGGASGPAWAPVADDGAVVGDDAAAAFAFAVVVEVGALGPLGLVLDPLAVGAPGLASYGSGASEAWAGEGAGHRLRLRLAALTSYQVGAGWAAVAGPTNQARQPRQRPWAWPRTRPGALTHGPEGGCRGPGWGARASRHARRQPRPRRRPAP